MEFSGILYSSSIELVHNLISGPRNISTALMYAFAERPDMTVVDEPFYAAYLKRSGIQHPGRKEVLESQSQDPNQVWAQLQTLGNPHLFIKNMAHHMLYTPNAWWLEVKNIFLVRHPKEVISSFAKVMAEPSLQDIGLAAQTKYLKLLLEHGQQPVVLDMEQLLLDPDKAIGWLCDQLGLPNQKEMLSWPDGPRPEDGVWAKYWYHSVHQSTGFGPYHQKDITLPKKLQKVYEEALTHYENLKAYAAI